MSASPTPRFIETYFDVALQGTRLILFILFILSGCFLVAAA